MPYGVAEDGVGFCCLTNALPSIRTHQRVRRPIKQTLTAVGFPEDVAPKARALVLVVHLDPTQAKHIGSDAKMLSVR